MVSPSDFCSHGSYDKKEEGIVRNVGLREGIAIALAETEVDHMDDIRFLSQTHNEIIGLDVSVNEVFAVDVFNALNQLDCQHTNCFY